MGAGAGEHVGGAASLMILPCLPAEGLCLHYFDLLPCSPADGVCLHCDLLSITCFTCHFCVRLVWAGSWPVRTSGPHQSKHTAAAVCVSSHTSFPLCHPGLALMVGSCPAQLRFKHSGLCAVQATDQQQHWNNHPGNIYTLRVNHYRLHVTSRGCTHAVVMVQQDSTRRRTASSAKAQQGTNPSQERQAQTDGQSATAETAGLAPSIQHTRRRHR
jgi:hypothetical protein